MQIYDGRDDKKAAPTNETANVISAGKCPCPTTDHMTLRRNGRVDWSLFYCESGIMSFDDQKVIPGQVWIYPPNVPQRYIVSAADNTVYYYLHFNGRDIAGLFERINIKPLTVLTTKGFSPEIFDKLIADASDESPLSALEGQYHALQLFARIARSTSRSEQVSQKSGLMKRVIDDMEHTFAEPYNVSKYAAMLKISVSRFNHLFSESVGIPPYAYCTKLRMENAQSLLENTDMKINEIAVCTGYTDAMYFTQAFKHYTGMTPREYRHKKIQRYSLR